MPGRVAGTARYDRPGLRTLGRAKGHRSKRNGLTDELPTNLDRLDRYSPVAAQLGDNRKMMNGTVIRNLVVTAAIALTVVACVECQERHDQGWTKKDLLGGTLPPERYNDKLPLTDQGNSGNWQIDEAFTDDFAGETLDPGRWRTYLPGGAGQSPGYYDSNNIAVKNGHLRLEVVKRPAGPNAGIGPHIRLGTVPREYGEAAIETPATTRYGYYEVKAKIARANVDSCFYLYDREQDVWTELDIFEASGTNHEHKQHVFVTGHVFYDHPNHIEDKFQIPAAISIGEDVADDYHVFGLDWEPEQLRFYIDGKLVRSGPNVYFHQPLKMALGVEIVPAWFGIPTDSELPAGMEVKYVHVWKHGAN